MNAVNENGSMSEIIEIGEGRELLQNEAASETAAETESPVVPAEPENDTDDETNAIVNTESAEIERSGLTDSQKKSIRIAACIFLAIVAVCMTAWLLPSSAQLNIGNRYEKSADINASIESGIANLASSSLEDIYELPEVYILPVSCEPAPEPNDDCFTVEYNSNGRVESGTYTDATISVTVWKEYRDNTVYNFAEVKINHPTQFRTMFATGDYSTASKCATPLDMAKQSNAVVAINSDFCRYNQNGTLIIRGGDFYKHTPSGWEILLVDENGDFNFAIDSEVELTNTSSGVEWNGKVIYNTFSFGPVLVRNGSAVTDYSEIKAAIHGRYLTGNATVARAAIGQLGELHYLLCTVDGTRGETAGCTLPQLAAMMEEKGCISAYNLDGGHSATLVFNDTLVNVPASKDNTGAQRAQSDIIYFASAIPD